MSADERRHFTRIPMDSRAEIACGDQRWQSELLDISLKGVLLQTPEGFDELPQDACTIRFSLDGTEVEIEMAGAIVHKGAEHIGFRCDQIDLESITHLKRMVELNLGNEALLERELSELLASD